MNQPLINKLPIFINGVTIYPMTSRVFEFLYDNVNYVVVLAEETEPFKPVGFMRSADFISMVPLKQAGLVECMRPYNLSNYPATEEYYNNRSMQNAMLYASEYQDEPNSRELDYDETNNTNDGEL